MKNNKRILSLVLALMMCLSLVSVPVYAEGEGADEPEYIAYEDFEGYEVDSKVSIFDGFAQTPPTNKILADDGGNKFVRLPFAGHCPSNTGEGYSGNADMSIIMNSPEVSYEIGKYLIVEADYRWEPDDVAPRIESQFRYMTGIDENGEVKNFQWISLFRINTSTSSVIGCGQLTGNSGNIEPTKWNNIRVLINLEAGTYDTYVNNQLYAVSGNLRPEAYEGNLDGGSGEHTGCKNFTFRAGYMIVAKLNKDAFTYSDDTGKDPYDVYLDLDNVRSYYPNNLIEAQYNGATINVLPNQAIDFDRASQTFLYAEISKDGGDPVVTLNTSQVIDAPGYVINTYYADGASYLTQNFAIFEKISALSADYGFKGDLPPVGTYAFGQDIDPETSAVTNYLKFPLVTSGTVDSNGVGDGSYVDKNMAYANKSVSYLDAATVDISADYFFSAGAKANVQAQLQSADYVDATTNATATKDWVDLWSLNFNGSEAGKLNATGTRVAENANEPLAGQWFNVLARINLLTGTYDLYLNGELYMAGCTLGGGITKVTIKENTLLASKLNKLNVDYYGNTVTGFVADSYFAVNNIKLADGPKANVKLNGANESIIVGTVLELIQDGKLFLGATITYAPASEGEASVVENILPGEATQLIITEKMDGATIDISYLNVLFLTDFEDAVYTVNAPIATGDVFETVHTYQAVKSEGEGEDANKYIRIPFQGTAGADAGTGNYDNAMQVKTPGFSLGDAEKMVISVDYRPHFHDLGNADAQDPTTTALLQSVIANRNGGVFRKEYENIELYTLNLKTGHLTGVGTPVEDAQPLVSDQWNTVKVIINLRAGTYETYVNDALYATQGYISATNESDGLTNIEVAENMLVLAKTGKNVGAYRDDTTAPIGTADMSYVDVDEITLRYVKDVIVTVDGFGKTVKEDELLDLTKKNADLMLAVVTVNGKTTYTTDTSIRPAEDMKIVTAYMSTFQTLTEAEFRLGTPGGIRFVTVFDTTGLLDLRYLDLKSEDENPDGIVKSVNYGTMIAPADYLAEGEDFTMEVLDNKMEEGVPGYLKVYANPRHVYDYSGELAIGISAYAGSLTNVLEENYARDFIGRGFIEVEMVDGAKITYYADWENNSANISDLAAEALLNNAEASDLMKSFINGFIVED